MNVAERKKYTLHGHNILPSGFRYRGIDKSLARPGRKQATGTEDFYFHISYS